MTAEITHRATRENGPSIVDGRLVWTSATGITTADPNSTGGCLRKWFYDAVEGRKGPSTKSQRAGTELHSEIEDKLRKGTTLRTPLALAGAHFIPQPGSALHIEKPISFKTRDGVGIFGHVDLYNLRQEYLDDEGVLQPDPARSFEVKDWKTTSDFQYAKSERELAENVQLVTYAEAGFREWQDFFDTVRLTHVYFRTRGAPAARLVTVLQRREEIASRWEYSESVVRSMSDAAKETTADRVPANLRSCNTYGGCAHRTYCAAAQFNSLDSMYERIAQDHIQERKVGIIASTPGLIQGAAPAVSMQQHLAQEEQQMRAQAAQIQQQVPTNPVELLNVVQRIISYGYGCPALGGNLAQAYAAAGGQQVAPGTMYPGVMAPQGAKRSLHPIQLFEVANVFQLEGELAAERGPVAAPHMMQPPTPQAPPPAPPAPVQLPPSAPAFTQQVAQAYNSILAPGTPESMPQLAAVAPKDSVQYTQPIMSGTFDAGPPVEAPAAKPKGRPKKVQDTAPEGGANAPQTAASAPPTAVSLPAAAPAMQVTPAAGSSLPTEKTGGGFVLVNGRMDGVDTKSLASYVDYINANLSKRYSVMADGKPGIQDVRCVPKDSPLAFGGWKGAVREVVKADPPPEGLYHLDTFMDELNEAVADALRVVAMKSGWFYFRGVR